MTMRLSHSNPIVLSARRGHTLLEMLLSLVLLSMVAASVGSAMMFASSANPDPDGPEITLGNDSRVLGQIAEDLAVAKYVLEQTPTSVTIVVSDRTGDGIPDRIRYAWAGSPGDPLTFELNDLGAVNLLESVETFQMAFTVEQGDTALPVAMYFGEEKLLDSIEATVTGSKVKIEASNWYAQIVNPSYSSGSLGFLPTRVILCLSGKSLWDGVARVELRDRSGNTPGSTVFGAGLIQESEIGATKVWHELALGSPQFVQEDTDLALMISYVSGDKDVIQVDQNTVPTLDGGRLSSDDGGATWARDLTKNLLFRQYGRELLAEDSSYEISTQRLTKVDLRLQSVAVGRSTVRRTVQMMLAPRQLEGYAQADFEGDPTASDLNADGQADLFHDSGDFPEDSISGGLWNGDGQLIYNHGSLASASVIRVTARMRSNDTLGPAIYGPYTVNADDELLPIITQLRDDGAGGQELVLYNDTTMADELAVIGGLPEGLIDIGLTVIPGQDLLHIEANRESMVTLKLDRVANPGTVDTEIRFGSTGGVVAFGSLDIKVGGAYAVSTDTAPIDGGLISDLLDILFP